MTDLTLVVGKSYKTACGLKVIIEKKDGYNNFFSFPFRGSLPNRNSFSLWDIGGHCVAGKHLDIIAEWETMYRDLSTVVFPFNSLNKIANHGNDPWGRDAVPLCKHEWKESMGLYHVYKDCIKCRAKYEEWMSAKSNS